MLKSVISVLVFMGAVAVFAGEKHAEADAKIKAACSAEIAATGCADKDLGKGLLKCMHAYKKEHKEFKFSEGCKDVKKELKSMRQARKEAKPSISTK